MYVVRPRSGAQRDMAILSDALKANNTYLTSLNLQGNQLKATEATELFQALALNTTLTELSLFDNNISDAGARAVQGACGQQCAGEARPCPKSDR